MKYVLMDLNRNRIELEEEEFAEVYKQVIE